MHNEEETNIARLKRMEEKIDSIKSATTRLEILSSQQAETQSDHEQRIRCSEQRINFAVGAISFITVISLLVGIYSIIKH